MTRDNSIQNWIDAKNLFEKFIDLPIDQSLETIKRDTSTPFAVQSILINLVKSQSKDQTLVDQADLSFFNALKNVNEDLSGQSMGDYRLLERIGEGGMSHVYKAKRTGSDIQKFVALKLLSSVDEQASETLKILFEREQVTLSKLNHPNIISFHHGGISENGIPFLVMDYVEGAVAINHFVKEQKLTRKATVKLVAKIAGAIHYAHQNLIIHKDLKPTNILIDKLQTPCVVDFGIASFKNIGTTVSCNLTAQIFTPDYASPEQIRNENVSANSDVFSLGALLLELLTEQKPLPEYSSIEIDKTQYKLHINNLIEQSKLDIDLSLVITKALQIDSSKRYSSMLEFKEDLLAYLAIRPITAHPATAYYLFKKYIQRNPGLSLSIMAFTLSAIAGVLSTVQQKNKAQLEALKAQQVTQFLIESIQANDPDINKGKDVSVKELLLNAKVNIQETSFQDQQLTTALEQTIGSALAKIGQYREAEKLLKNSIANDAYNFNARLSLASLYLDQQYFEKAQDQHRFLLQHKSKLSHNQNVHSIQIETNLLFNKGKFQEAIKTISTLINSKSLSIKQSIDSQFTLSKITNELGDHQKSIDILYKTLEISNKEFSETSTSSTNILFRIANIYSNMSPLPEKKLYKVYGQTLTNQIIIYGKNHPLVAKTYLQYGFALKAFGNAEKAREYALKARKIAIDNFGENHMLTAHIDLLTSQLNMLENKPKVAISQLEKVVSIYESHYGEDHFETNQTKTTLAGYYLKNKQGDKALSMLRPLYALQKQHFGETNKATIYVKMNLLKALNLTQKFQKATEEGIELLAISKANLGDESVLTIGTQMTLAQSLMSIDEAEKSMQLSQELLSYELIKNNERYLKKVTELYNQAQDKKPSLQP